MNFGEEESRGRGSYRRRVVTRCLFPTHPPRMGKRTGGAGRDRRRSIRGGAIRTGHPKNRLAIVIGSPYERAVGNGASLESTRTWWSSKKKVIVYLVL